VGGQASEQTTLLAIALVLVQESVILVGLAAHRIVQARSALSMNVDRQVSQSFASVPVVSFYVASGMENAHYPKVEDKLTEKVIVQIAIVSLPSDP
jgi:hypothetical protein